MIELATGDLFDAKVDALVNPVNTAGVMGKGLALQFKQRFPANTRAYEAAFERGELAIGAMFVFDTGRGVPRFIVNFPTKKHWRSPSKLAWIEDGLVALVDVVRDRGIRSIAIPPLGAGLGGLAWSDVGPRVERALAPLLDVRTLIYAPPRKV